MTETVLGVIGGSGVYEIDGLSRTRWVTVDTPWGEPSDQLLEGMLGDQRVVFLPRHGRGHSVSPTELNSRANIDAMKRMGVTDLLSVSAVGSFRESLSPGTFVLCDQYLDRTNSRVRSYFGSGCVAHVSFASPACNRLRELVLEAGKDVDVTIVESGTYVCIEGPQFSTLFESRLYKGMDLDVVGMTAMPEARLAREAEICYLTIAMVTDYDCWNEEHAAVSVEQVIGVLRDNAGNARQLVRVIAERMQNNGHPCSHGCDRSLEFAIMTAPDKRNPELVSRLDAVAGRVLG